MTLRDKVMRVVQKMQEKSPALTYYADELEHAVFESLREVPEAVAVLSVGGVFESTEGFEVEEWTIDANQRVCDRLNERVERMDLPLYTIPPGYMLVPVEPTIFMCIAGVKQVIERNDEPYFIYKAMLAAAPNPLDSNNA